MPAHPGTGADAKTRIPRMAALGRVLVFMFAPEFAGGPEIFHTGENFSEEKLISS
jgi:hypothetical protein